MPVLVNGSPAAHISVHDRGFLYGDGVFETMRHAGSRIPLWSYHRSRLESALARLGIACDIAVIESDIASLLSQESGHGVIRLVVTRGESKSGYAPSIDAVPHRVLETRPLPAMFGDITVRVCDWRLPVQPALAGIKHLNRLDQVMARREWDDATIADGLMLDVTGAVIEGTMSNLFLRKGDEWLTPDLSRCGVAGVMRSWVMNEGLPALGCDVDVRDVTLTQLLHADEVFLCNSVRGVMPVTRLQSPGKTWAVSDQVRALQSSVGKLWHA
ncbi:MAG: aminodeoxychorismate lyase [Gammaproteobacteria bacterium]|nr:MAG: aminodeoxychorismate lyase [Gammaproteobacteria bacterium]